MSSSKSLPPQSSQEAKHSTPTSPLLADSKKGPQVATSRFRRFALDWWQWELLGVLLSLCCSVALIVILLKYDNQPVPQWRHGITLNAIISILATTAKGSLLLAVAEAISQYKWLWFRRSQRRLQDLATFDDASRGPWGAVNLLLSIHLRDIASIGALITVLSLAFDPFMQQVVVYKPRSVPQGTATIGRAQLYNVASPDQNHIELPLKAAFYNGIFNRNAAPQLTPLCSSGNCTWEPFSSLAFCSQCKDVTSVSSLVCNTTGSVVTSGESQTQCNYSIPNLPIVQFGTEVDSDDGSTGPSMLATAADVIITASDRGFFEIIGIRNPLAGFARILFGNAKTSLTECALFPCVKTYNVSVSQGKFVSHELRSWRNETGTDLYYDDTILSPPRSAVSNMTKNMTFTIPDITTMNLMYFFQSVFTGYANYSQSGGPTYSTDVMEALNDADNMTQLMNNVAASMTDYIRNVSSTVEHGTAWGSESFVNVRWAWLILPLALAPLSFLFLLSAIWISGHHNVKVWKSSSLVTVFHGLERPPKPDVAVNRRSEMEEVAKELKVRLKQTSDESHNLMLSCNEMPY